MPKVLLASDGSDLAIAAARRGLSLLAPDSEVTVVTVVPLATPVAGVTGLGFSAAPMVDPRTLEDTQAAQRARAHADIEATIAALGVDAERRVEHGDPGTVICEVARSGDFDAVIIGSHGSGFLERALLGSVSYYVLHHAPCPVVVVRNVE